MAAQCERCGGDIRYGKCRECGAVDMHAAPGVRADDVSRCPFDGATLHANGWCEKGDGYPITRACPFVCDVCRQPLTWAGTCLTCAAHAPGNRYDYTEKGQHWQLVENGPFEILPQKEQARMAKEFGVMMAKLTAKMTLERERKA